MTSHSEVFYSLKHHFWLLEDLDSYQARVQQCLGLFPDIFFNTTVLAGQPTPKEPSGVWMRRPIQTRSHQCEPAHSLLRKPGWSVCNQKSPTLPKPIVLVRFSRKFYKMFLKGLGAGKL